jgi:hypothetical protein
MAVSDWGLWLAKGYGPDPVVYGCFALNVLWGRLLLRTGGPGRLVAVSLATSLQFFLVTNFAVWLSASVEPARLPAGHAVEFQTFDGLAYPAPVRYARNLEGLAACYAAAIPFWQTNAPPLGFLGNQILGDLLYCALLFGVYAALARGLPLPRAARTSPGGTA